MYLHYALDLWFEKVVKPHCRGEALMCRYADDWVCAFRFQEDAERFYRVLPKRLGKFNLQVAPEKTRILRFSRFHPGMKRRFTFLGFEFYWKADRQGVPRVKRRTARKKLPARLPTDHGMDQATSAPAGASILHRAECAAAGPLQLLWRARATPRSLYRFFHWAMDCAFKWLNRRGGKRRSFTLGALHPASWTASR